MPSYKVHAAYDGATFRETFYAPNDEDAERIGRDLAAKNFNMESVFARCVADNDIEWFDGEIDGLEIERVRSSRALENVRRYDAELSALAIPPNGDDFNALIALVKGGVYKAPTMDGR